MKSNTKKLRLWITTLALMAGLAFASPLAAQGMNRGAMNGPSGMSGGMMAGMMGGMMGKHMQMHGNVPIPMLFKKAAMRVPADKKQAFAALKMDVVPAWLRQQTEVKIARMVWKERLMDPTASEKEIRKAYAQLTRQQEKLNQLGLNATLKLRALLGPETFVSLFQPAGMMGMPSGMMGQKTPMQGMKMGTMPMMTPGAQNNGTSK